MQDIKGKLKEMPRDHPPDIPHAAILQRRKVAIDTYEHSESVDQAAGSVEETTVELLKEYQGNLAQRKRDFNTANSELDAAREDLPRALIEAEMAHLLCGPSTPQSEAELQRDTEEAHMRVQRACQGVSEGMRVARFAVP